MTERPELLDESPAQFDAAFKRRLHALVDAWGTGEEAASAANHQPLLEAARQLVNSKLSMSGTKSETRKAVEKLINKHLHGIFSTASGGVPGSSEPLGIEIILGTILSGSMMVDFADAVDRAILAGGAPREYSFAGRADFISLEEVLQLLGAGKHRGRLTLEKPDNRIDIFVDNSVVAFLDPHRFIRRVLPMSNKMNYREVSTEMLERAEQRHADEGLPIFISLHRDGFFRDGELREMMRTLGSEVLYEFLREQAEVAYTYHRMDELPGFAMQHHLKMPITPILLEGNKRRDEWRSMNKVFPDADEPLKPVDNLIARIASMNLGVLEIKMLAQINGETSPRQLVSSMGLPLQDVYGYLVRFAKEGVLLPPGGMGMLDELAMSIEESVEIAWQALDANDDNIAVSSALDKVLGFDFDFDNDDDDEEIGGPRLHTVDEEIDEEIDDD